MAVQTVQPEAVYRKEPERVILDVRSPGEFLNGHIPDAQNLPLFTDDERARVGTAYKQESRDKAMELGLAIAGPKMAWYISEAQRLAPEKKVLVHCWRGGKRSASMAWLFDLCGMDVELLQGGYKAYRGFGRQLLSDQPLRMVTLGGQTGSGKTRVLQALRAMGQQTIDLEHLASHKGSAFGSLGEQPQPSPEHFENLLVQAYYAMDPKKVVFVENESLKIGTCPIPLGFFLQMHTYHTLYIQIPEDLRIQHLLQDYAGFNKEDLKERFAKIERKLGGDAYREALRALDENDYAKAAQIALRFYDKTYQYGFEKASDAKKLVLTFDHANATEIAKEIVKRIETFEEIQCQNHQP